MKEPVANHYLRKHSGELRWIRNALRAALLPLASTQSGSAALAMDVAPAFQEPDYAFVRRRWLQDQRDYFENAVRRHRLHLYRTHVATCCCLLSQPCLQD